MPHSINFTQSTGQIDTHIDFNSIEMPVHHDLVAPLTVMRERARAQGFLLRIASGFRSFERQLGIWNAKALGHRDVLSDSGERLTLAELTDEQRVFAILRWSALPGTSRHHWGCDVDIYDSSQISEGYAVQLTTDECEVNGPFAAMHRWLDGYLDGAQFFFRPYCRDTGGVAPEPWHLSYRPLAEKYAKLVTESALKALLEKTDIQLKPVILDNFHYIYNKYVMTPC